LSKVRADSVSPRAANINAVDSAFRKGVEHRPYIAPNSLATAEWRPAIAHIKAVCPPFFSFALGFPATLEQCVHRGDVALAGR